MKKVLTFLKDLTPVFHPKLENKTHTIIFNCASAELSMKPSMKLESVWLYPQVSNQGIKIFAKLKYVITEYVTKKIILHIHIIPLFIGFQSNPDQNISHTMNTMILNLVRHGYELPLANSEH